MLKDAHFSATASFLCEAQPRSPAASLFLHSQLHPLSHFFTMSKRRRTTGGFRVAVRPVDKAITAVSLTGVSTTQQQTVLVSAATACTVLGIRWSFFVEGDGGTSTLPHDYRWAIILLKEGQTADNMGQTNAAHFYDPEQNVLAWGFGTSRTDSDEINFLGAPDHWESKSKSMRKLMIGDRIAFIVRGTATQTVRVLGAVQMFCKF